MIASLLELKHINTSADVALSASVPQIAQIIHKALMGVHADACSVALYSLNSCPEHATCKTAIIIAPKLFSCHSSSPQASGIPMDYDDWHADVHGALPYERVLSHDNELQRILESLPQPKWIFTNGDIRHAERCLACLGIRHCFEVHCFSA